MNRQPPLNSRKPGGPWAVLSWVIESFIKEKPRAPFRRHVPCLSITRKGLFVAGKGSTCPARIEYRRWWMAGSSKCGAVYALTIASVETAVLESNALFRRSQMRRKGSSAPTAKSGQPWFGMNCTAVTPTCIVTQEEAGKDAHCTGQKLTGIEERAHRSAGGGEERHKEGGGEFEGDGGGEGVRDLDVSERSATGWTPAPPLSRLNINTPHPEANQYVLFSPQPFPFREHDFVQAQVALIVLC